MKRVVGFLMSGCVAIAAGCAANSAQDASSSQDSSRTQRLTTNAQPTPGASGTDGKSQVVSFADDQVIARIGGQPITRKEFLTPLIESHGLQILMALVQLDLAKQQAREAKVTVTQEDIRREQDFSLQKMFKDADVKEQDALDAAESKGDAAAAQKLRETIRSDRETLLAEYLEHQHFSRTEFALKMEINAYLRKAVDRGLAGKITDAMVQTEFNVEFGETAQIRYMQLANSQEDAEARRRLKNGEDFAEVAEKLSHSERTAGMGGALPAFSRQTAGLPDTFKQMAFSLQPGQVSDTLVLTDNRFIIKLEQKFPPKAVKFENVKESLRKSMYERLSQVAMEQVSAKLGQEVIKNLQISDRQLAKEYEKFQSRQDTAIRDRDKIDQQWKKERAALALTTQPATTEPAAAPAATAPATAATAPATQP